MIPGFFPDPTICRVGDDLYIANSSFEYSPGVPLWHSTDAVTWRQVGNALDRDENQPGGRAGAGGGVYAPTLRHHDGRFWLITTNVSGPPGQLLTSAPAITGPWSPGIVVTGVAGIDPDLAWDDEGCCYLTFSSNDPAAPGIAQVRVDLESGRVLDGPRSVFGGTGLAYPEGPHLFRRGRWWYLLFAEGGTERGHCVSVARAPRPDGPFVACPQNPILTRRSTTFPVQNTGHGDAVRLADGTWALVYLGVRPSGGTPLYHVNGRETFLAGLDWVDEWPVVLPDQYRVPPARTDFIDTFMQPALHPRWVSPGVAPSAFAHPLPAGGIRLHAAESAAGAPAMLAVRTRDPSWRVTTALDAAQSAALRVRLDERHWAEVRMSAGEVHVHARIGPLHGAVGTSVQVSGPVTLGVAAVESTHGGPDDVTFSVGDPDGNRLLARIDGRYLSTEVAGGFTGRTVGVRAVAVSAIDDGGAPDNRAATSTTVDWVRYEALRH